MDRPCPVCHLATSIEPGPHNLPVFRCAACGDYQLQGMAQDVLKRLETQPRLRPVVSHAIRRMQRQNSPAPIINEDLARIMLAGDLPNPQRQADNLIIYLGDAGLPLGTFVYQKQEAYIAIAGAADDPRQGKSTNFNLVRRWLSDKGLTQSDPNPPGGDIGLRLTFEGWARYEHLRQELVESRVAFMAMGYGNVSVARTVAECFMPAVKETGFELFRLDSRPKSGLIDNRMRVEIRTAKFLVCDLTDENRGAYWEAGFAEGAGKPVFYTCEKSKFDKEKSHFDTAHMFTVVWSEKALDEAAEELKAAIRNEFPNDAIMADPAARRE